MHVDSGTDGVQSVTVDYLAWDDNARQPSQLRTTPSSGKWSATQITYNGNGLPARVATSGEGSAGERTVFTGYSADGYFARVLTNALGHTTTTIIDPRYGTPTSETDANGLVTTHHYDAFGRPIRLQAPRVGEQSAAPDRYVALQWCGGNGACVGVSGSVYLTLTQQAGSPQSITYHDVFGRAIRSQRHSFDGTDWIASEVAYNARGLMTFESAPYSVSTGTAYGTRYTSYDALGRALGKTVDQPDGHQLTITYTHDQGSDGLTTRVVANGLTLTRRYNGLEQLTETTDALGGVTRYAYDGAGRPIVLQDANGHRITSRFNALGQKLWVNDPNLGHQSFTYNGYGEVTTQTDANRQTTAYSYDALGRPTRREVDGVEEARWTYDGAHGKGLVHQEMGGDGGFMRTHHYDVLSRPMHTTTAIDGERYHTQIYYDSRYGWRNGLRYPSNLTVEYQYNARGYATRTINAKSGYVYRTLTAMDAWGNWQSAELADETYGVERDFYAQTGQMKSTTFSHQQVTHQSLAYRYDDFGNLTHQQVQVPTEFPSSESESYVYDALHRLTRSTRGSGASVNYGYDAVGNLTRKDDYAGSYHYNATQPNAVASVSLVSGGSRTYGYDGNGNRTHEDGVQTVWYNAYNKPRRISRGDRTLSFSYGADQMRYRQTDGDITTLYIGKIYERISGGGVTKHRHFIDDMAVITVEDHGIYESYEMGLTHRDRLGSTTAIGDPEGVLRETFSYDAFGKPRDGNQADRLPAVVASGFSTRGFTDHEHLDAVELIHMNGRVYDYHLGRFLSVDPFIQSPGNSQSVNPYSYIMNNPLSGTDPTGYVSESEVEVDVKPIQKASTGSRIRKTVGHSFSGTVTGGGVTTEVSGTVSNGVVSGSFTGTDGHQTGSGEFSTSLADIGGQSERSNAGSGTDQASNFALAGSLIVDFFDPSDFLIESGGDLLDENGNFTVETVLTPLGIRVPVQGGHDGDFAGLSAAQALVGLEAGTLIAGPVGGLVRNSAGKTLGTRGAGKSIKDQAADLVPANANKNRVTLRSEKTAIRNRFGW